MNESEIREAIQPDIEVVEPYIQDEDKKDAKKEVNTGAEVEKNEDKEEQEEIAKAEKRSDAIINQA